MPDCSSTQKGFPLQAGRFRGTRLKFHFACMLCLVSQLVTAGSDTLAPDTSENDATIEALQSHSMALLDRCADKDAIQTDYSSIADVRELLKLMPIPVQQYILSFACLCDMQELDKRVSHLRETLGGLKKALKFYMDNYRSEVASIALIQVGFNLFGEDIDYIWENLSTEYRSDYLADQFLRQANRLQNLRTDYMKPEYFYADWQHIIYRGLYCIPGATLHARKRILS